MTFAVGQRVMTATSDLFVENRRGVIRDVLTHDRYVMNDRGLRLVLHASELVPDDDFISAERVTDLDRALQYAREEVAWWEIATPEQQLTRERSRLVIAQWLLRAA